MRTRFRHAVAALAVALVIPAAAGAQQATAAPSEAQVESMLMEFQQIHLQLEEIQAQALQDPQLSAAQQQLGEEIRQAMETTDPALHQRLVRANELETEAMAAQQTGDVAKLQQLMIEAQQIEEQFLTAQQRVMQAPAIATKVSTFQTQLERRMGELNPNTQSLIARFRELEVQLAAAMEQGA